MLENIKKCGYEIPTPVQAYCLPAVFTNNDVIAIAQTGESKLSSLQRTTADTIYSRLRKDRRFPYPDHFETDGQG